MRNKIPTLIWSLLFLGLGIVWYTLMHSDENEDKTSVESVMTVTITQAISETIEDTIELNGLIVPRDEVVINAEISGTRILEILFEEGNKVTKGQTLAKLDSANLKSQYEQLLAELGKAKSDFDRVYNIRNTGAVSQEVVTEKKAAYESLKARADIAKTNLERTEITSPVTGIIYLKDASLGQVIQGNETLFKIAANGKTELDALVSETMLSKLHADMKAIVTLSGQKETIPATLRLVSPHIEATTRTANVRLTLNTDNFVPVGMFAKAQLTLSKQTGLTLPSSAIQEDAKGAYVWIVSDDKVQRQNVRVTFRSNGRYLIEGIGKETKVVARAGPLLQEGDKIFPLEENSLKEKQNP